MKIWKEQCNDIKEYFEWLNVIDDNCISVLSYNITGINFNNNIFYEYCKNEIKYDLIDKEKKYIYILALEMINDINSKIENYNKCWKKISKNIDMDFFQLGTEIKIKNNDICYFFSVARTEISNIDKIMELLNQKYNYRIFISNKAYSISDEKCIKKFHENISIENYNEIAYEKYIEMCIKNNDIACRFGRDSLGMELAFIYK
jgi:hypothetical protein